MDDVLESKSLQEVHRMLSWCGDASTNDSRRRKSGCPRCYRNVSVENIDLKKGGGNA